MDDKKNNLEPEKEEEYVDSTSAEDILADVIADEKAAKENESDEQAKPEEDEDEEENEPAPKKKSEHKKFKHGMMSTVYTVIFIVAVVLVNIIATIIFDKYPITFDLTKNNSYSISEESIEYVEGIDTEVTIKVFATEDAFAAINDYSKQANEVMKKYTQYNSKISVEYIDVDSNPDIVSEYADENISAYDIIVETISKDENGKEILDDNDKPIKRIRKIALTELIEFTDEFEEQIDQYKSYYGMSKEEFLVQYFGSETNAFYYAAASNLVESSTADQAFVSALMAVTDPDPVVVSILTGRNELASTEYFEKLLLANGYTVNTVNITSEEIPEDTDLCVIPAPQNDYLDADIAKVDEFINNDGELGKNLIYIASYGQQETPNLDEFLEEYYIKVADEGFICENDPDHFYTQSYITLADEISDSFADEVQTENPQIICAVARPIVLLEDEKGKISTEAYVKSTESAYVGEMQSDGTITTLSSGQQIYAAMSSKAKFNDDGSANYSNILVVGSESLLSDEYLKYDQYQNREYFLSVTNGMCGKTNTGITIEPKVISGNIFDITDKQITTLKIIFIGVIPALTLIIGLVIWLRRKNR